MEEAEPVRSAGNKSDSPSERKGALPSGALLVGPVDANPEQGKQTLLTRQGQDELFCQLYVKLLSPSDAAIHAYHMDKELARTQGWHKLREPAIAARVAYIAEQYAKRVGVHPIQIIEAMRKIAFADNMAIFTEEQLKELRLDHLTYDQRCNIAGLKYTVLYGDCVDPLLGKIKKRKMGHVIDIKWYSKEKALEMLARVCALFQDRIPEDERNDPYKDPQIPDKPEIFAAKVAAYLMQAERRKQEEKDVEGLL